MDYSRRSVGGLECHHRDVASGFHFRCVQFRDQSPITRSGEPPVPGRGESVAGVRVTPVVDELVGRPVGVPGTPGDPRVGRDGGGRIGFKDDVRGVGKVRTGLPGLRLYQNVPVGGGPSIFSRSSTWT